MGPDSEKIKANLIPFGLGKRQCVGIIEIFLFEQMFLVISGQSLALAELFLIGITLIQNYEFHTIPGQEKPSCEAINISVLQPEPFECMITKRKYS